MMLISGIVSIIIQKNTLCTDKIRVIYFCPKTFIFLFSWGKTEPPSDSPCVYARGSRSNKFYKKDVVKKVCKIQMKAPLSESFFK